MSVLAGIFPWTWTVLQRHPFGWFSILNCSQFAGAALEAAIPSLDPFAATSRSNAPVRTVPPDFTCTHMR
jgi:hypothetical protein